MNFEFLGRVVYQLSNDTDFHYELPKIENWDGSNLKEFEKQPSELGGVDFEWVRNSGCAEYGFHGIIAIEIPLSDGYFIVINWFE